MKMKGFRGDALIAWGRRGVRQNSRKKEVQLPFEFFAFGSTNFWNRMALS
jgi:hypothetical protein